MDYAKELGGDLLAGVSRSFNLTIQLLPEPVRVPVSLGYLLARLLDTIADAAEAAPAAVRRERLRDFIVMLKHGPDSEALAGLRKDITQRLPEGDEKRLLGQALPLLGWLASMPAGDRSDLTRVLLRIGHGQELDLIRFGDGTRADDPAKRGAKALATARELEEYTYFVAGGVGEFWTRVCARHLGDGFAELPVAEMLSLGKNYGKGLQVINVLRDLRADLENGRSYLPLEQLQPLGLAPGDLLLRPQEVLPVIDQWRERAVALLDDGWRYVCAIKDWPLRYACALPILIGLETLGLVAAQNPLEQAGPVKLPRSKTMTTLLTAKLGRLAQAWLNGMYSRRRKKAAGG